MAKESSQHEGHRQRMRARVEQYGLESLEPHEALEYVLYITNTRKDTNGLAHVLINRFGDFAGVLDASEEDLLTVEGVGPSTARMLHLLPQVGRYYTQCAVNGKKCMKTTDQLVEYLMAQFARDCAGTRPAGCAGWPQPHQGAVLAAGRHQRPGESGDQGCGGGSPQGRYRQCGALP